MKKLICGWLLLAGFLMVAVGSCMTSLISVAAAEPDVKDESNVVRSTLTAYSARSNYNGTEIKTNLKASDIVDFQVTEHGGIMQDVNGTYAFTHYAKLSFSFHYEPGMSISGTTAKVVYENEDEYDGKYVGQSKKQRLGRKIGYGAILTTNEAADGSRKMWSTITVRYYDDKAKDLQITEDGNYHIVFLMTVEEGTTKKKLVIEYQIPIRTKIYITDAEGEYHVKDAGAYHKAIKLDALGRPNVEIRVDGVRREDQTILRDVDRYRIQVYGNGFLCEDFYFEIFSRDDEHAYIYLSNSRRQLDTISYEAEHEFKLSWYSMYETEMTYWKDGDMEKEYPYTQGTVITTPGYYVFTLHVPSLENQEKTFLVRLVGDDFPQINYATLNSNRFNNFKTKWYEVYDDTNDAYYCFSMAEYREAYDAALTVENQKVTDYGYYFVYKNEKYLDRVSLTEAMNHYALLNLKTVYYDPEAEQIEKYFSDAAFDGTVFLNMDFRFVRTSPSETNSVTLVHEDGRTWNIDFFTPLSSYNLGEGSYTIIEEDLYGNRTEYTGIVDLSAPELILDLNGEQRAGVYGSTYTASYFSVASMLDRYDGYTVLSVNDVYFYKDEYADKVFTEPGSYFVRAYDRNQNMIALWVTIDAGNKLYTMSSSDGCVVLTPEHPDITVTKILRNGEEIDVSSVEDPFLYKASDVDAEYCVYFKDAGTGMTDCASFSVLAAQKEAEMEPAPSESEASEQKNETTDNDGIPLVWAILIPSIILAAGLGLGIYMIVRSRKK